MKNKTPKLFVVLETLRKQVGDGIDPYIKRFKEFEERIKPAGLTIENVIGSGPTIGYTELWGKCYTMKEDGSIEHFLEGIDSELTFERFLHDNFWRPLSDVLRMSVSIARKKHGKKYANQIERSLNVSFKEYTIGRDVFKWVRGIEDY